MTAIAPVPAPRAGIETFSITLSALAHDRVRLRIQDDAGAEVIGSVDLTLDEAIRMIRLKVVTMAYPIPYHDRLLRTQV
jgi:hypothetical protein